MKRRKRLTEAEAKYYLSQLVHATDHMHSKNIIHRDLKLGNLFCGHKMKLKVGDFGLATKVSFQGEKKRTICGTPNYIAPEVLSSKIGHSFEVDLWSIGVILYTMLIGRPPFQTSNVKTTYKRIKMNFYTFPDHITISSSAKDLIQKLLKKEPECRISIIKILEHDFLKGSIPEFLPISAMACPPPPEFTRTISGKTTS